LFGKWFKSIFPHYKRKNAKTDPINILKTGPNRGSNLKPGVFGAAALVAETV
jgi:hypothetical protein